MKPLHLWILAAVLAVGALYLLFFYIPRGGSPAASGAKAEGQILSKNSTPLADGRTSYSVQFVYADANRVNHEVTNQLTDQAMWDSLQRDQYVRVRYLPDKPDQAFIEGAQGTSAPHAGALRFLAWSALVAALICGYMAFRAGEEEAAPKGPVVANRS